MAVGPFLRAAVRPAARRASTASAGIRIGALGPGNRVLAGSSRLDVRFEGASTGMLLSVGDDSVLRRVRIAAWGRDIRVTIGSDVRLEDVQIHVAGDGGAITIGDGTTMESGCRLDATEPGSRIAIGRDCMISTNVQVRTSDAHGIFLPDGRRTNPPADITVGDHVWLGEGALLLKGADIGPGSVVGARAVVTRPSSEAGAVLVGSPARVLRRDIVWSRSYDTPVPRLP